MVRQFPCSNCGAMLVYDPGLSSLKCVYCGTVNAIVPSGQPVEELDLLAHLRDSTQEIEALLVRCDGCGAEQTLRPGVTAAECAFCGKPIVAQAASRRLIKPQSLLPFRIAREQAVDSFRRWIDSLWFAPGELKRRAETQKIGGTYVPAWTFDSDTTTPYRGQRGDDYWETETYTAYEGGRPVTRTRQVRKTRWTNVSGTVRHFFNDVLILATTSLPPRYGQELEPWDLSNLKPFEESYLSGFVAEAYHIDLPQGWQQAQAVIDAAVRGMILRDIGGDHQRIHEYRIRHAGTTFKHILLPVWISAYRYRGRTFQFLVNGRTGEVQGQRPYSAIKIAAFVLAIAGVVGTIIYFVSLHS